MRAALLAPLLLALSRPAEAQYWDRALKNVEGELAAELAADYLAGKPLVPDLQRLKIALKLEVRSHSDKLCKEDLCRRYPRDEDFQALAIELAPRLGDAAREAGSPLGWSCAFEKRFEGLLDQAPAMFYKRMEPTPGTREELRAPEAGSDENYYFSYPPEAALTYARELPRPDAAHRDEAAAYLALQTLRRPLLARNELAKKPEVDEKSATAAIKLLARIQAIKFHAKTYPASEDFARYGRSAARRLRGLAASVRRGRWDCKVDERLRKVLDGAVDRMVRAMPKGHGEPPPPDADELPYYR